MLYKEVRVANIMERQEDGDWGIRERNMKLSILIIFIAMTALTAYTVIKSLSSIDQYIFKSSAMKMQGRVECSKPVFNVKAVSESKRDKAKEDTVNQIYNFMSTFNVDVEFQQVINVYYEINGKAHQFSKQIRKSSGSFISSQNESGAIAEAKSKLLDKVYSNGQEVGIFVSKSNPDRAMLVSEYNENKKSIWTSLLEVIGTIILQVAVSVVLYRNREIDRFNDGTGEGD